MFHLPRYVIIFSIFLFQSGALKAEQMTFSSLIKVTLDHHPVLESARAELRASQQSLKEANVSIFPLVRLTGSYLEQEVPTVLTGGFDLSPGKIYSGAIEVEQPLFLGGKIWAGMDLRELQVTAAQLQYREAKQKTLSEILEMALNLALAEKKRDILLESEKVQSRFVDITRGRVRRGNGRQFELNQALANHLSYKTRIQQAETQLATARSQMVQLLNLEDPHPSLAWPGSPSSGSIHEKDLNAWIQQALAKRPDLLLAEEKVEVAEVDKRLNMADHLPQLSLGGKWGYSSLDRESFGDPGTRASEIVLGLSIPLFSGLSSVYQRRADVEKIASAEKQKEWLSRQIRAEVERLYLELNQAENLLYQSSEWAKAAEKALKEAIENYRLGLIDNFQVVQLQTGQEQARIAETEAIVAHNKAWMHWNRAVGKDLEVVFRNL